MIKSFLLLFLFPTMAFAQVGTGYYVSYDGTLWKSTDWGVNWVDQNSNLDNNQGFDFVNDSVGFYVAYDGVLWKTADRKSVV